MTALTAMFASKSAGALALDSILSTIVYACLGMLLLVVFAVILNLVFRLDLRKELIHDQNVGLGAAVAGMAIAIAIIIAGTIVS